MSRNLTNGRLHNFRADAECKWNMLGANAPLILKGRTRTAQLRFEAIDAPDTHFLPHDSVVRYYEPLHIANASRARTVQEVGVGNVVVTCRGSSWWRTMMAQEAISWRGTLISIIDL